MSLLAGVAVAPAIGLPTPAEAAPAIAQTTGTYGTGVRYPYWASYYAEYSYTTEECEAAIKKAMDKMVFTPPYSGPQTLNITIPAGTAMVYTDESRQVVKPAWKALPDSRTRNEKGP